MTLQGNGSAHPEEGAPPSPGTTCQPADLWLSRHHREWLRQPPESCVRSEDAAPRCLGHGDNPGTWCHLRGSLPTTTPWKGHGEGGPRHCQAHAAGDEGLPWQSKGRQSVITPASPTSHGVEAGAFFLWLSHRPAARTWLGRGEQRGRDAGATPGSGEHGLHEQPTAPNPHKSPSHGPWLT